MNELKQFLPDGYRKKGSKYFLKGDEDAEYSGTYLGFDKSGEFVPSTLFLNLIRGDLGEIVVSKKAEWLFSCGRDILKQSVLKNSEDKLVLVLNEQEDILGVALEKENHFKNVWDVGMYLRREIKNS